MWLISFLRAERADFWNKPKEAEAKHGAVKRLIVLLVFGTCSCRSYLHYNPFCIKSKSSVAFRSFVCMWTAFSLHENSIFWIQPISCFCFITTHYVSHYCVNCEIVNPDFLKKIFQSSLCVSLQSVLITLLATICISALCKQRLWFTALNHT